MRNVAKGVFVVLHSGDKTNSNAKIESTLGSLQAGKVVDSIHNILNA